MAGLDGEREHVARVFASIEQKPRVGAGGISKQQDVIAASWRRCVEGYGLEPAPAAGADRAVQYGTEGFPRPDRRSRDARAPRARPPVRSPVRPRLRPAVHRHPRRRRGFPLRGRPAGRGAPRPASISARCGPRTARAPTASAPACTSATRCRSSWAIISPPHNVSLTCTVAPIFGSDGRLAAVLDVSTPRRTDHAVQSIVRKMVATPRAASRTMPSPTTTAATSSSACRRYEDFSDAASDVLLALDADGRIVAASTGARRPGDRGGHAAGRASPRAHPRYFARLMLATTGGHDPAGANGGRAAVPQARPWPRSGAPPRRAGARPAAATDRSPPPSGDL